MKDRKVLFVSGSRGNWDIKEQGSKQSLSHHSNKEEAVEEARKLAQQSELSQVKVKGIDGRIQTEYTYGEDPRRTEG